MRLRTDGDQSHRIGAIEGEDKLWTDKDGI